MLEGDTYGSATCKNATRKVLRALCSRCIIAKHQEMVCKVYEGCRQGRSVSTANRILCFKQHRYIRRHRTGKPQAACPSHTVTRYGTDRDTGSSNLLG